MYNAGVSPEALQQVKNEGQRERQYKAPLFAMPIKHIKMAESKRLWREKRERERTGVEQTT